jgi:hypothetical protein
MAKKCANPTWGKGMPLAPAGVSSFERVCEFNPPQGLGSDQQEEQVCTFRAFAGLGLHSLEVLCGHTLCHVLARRGTDARGAAPISAVPRTALGELHPTR